MTSVYNIELREVTTKKMTIEASDKESAELTALNFHLGWSDKEENARIKELSVMHEGTISGEETELSVGLVHSSAVD